MALDTISLRIFPPISMFFTHAKKTAMDPAALAIHIIVCALLFLCSLASLVGVVLSHVDVSTGTLSFGTAAGSLSILAFAFTVVLWGHGMKTLLAIPEPPVKKK